VKHSLQQNKGASSRHKTNTNRLGIHTCSLANNRQNSFITLAQQALFCARYKRLLFRLFLWWPLTVLTRQTGQSVCAINQSIFLRCLWFFQSVWSFQLGGLKYFLLKEIFGQKKMKKGKFWNFELVHILL